jgi:ABC-type lipoprotein release transport system permease subunit
METIRTIVPKLDPCIAIGRWETLEDRVAGAVATPRLNSALLAAFATVAVVLTAIGVYGVMAYSVAQRRREIGIRLALGAPGRAVFRLVLRDGIRLVAWALVIGSALSMAMLPVLQVFVHGGARNHVAVVFVSALLLGLRGVDRLLGAGASRVGARSARGSRSAVARALSIRA